MIVTWGHLGYGGQRRKQTEGMNSRYHAFPANHSILPLAHNPSCPYGFRMLPNVHLAQCNALARRMVSQVTDTIMPRRCVFCGTRCDDRELEICAGCYDDLPWIDNSCARCAQPVAAMLPENVHCADCQVRPPPFSFAVAPLLYAFPVDAAIKALKFSRKLFYAPAFGKLLERSLANLPGDIDALLPVPLHWRRHAIRGFNQADELCKVLLKNHDITLISNVARKRSTSCQSGLDSKQRRRNLRSAFAVRGRIKSRHVLIVDDVITTGETCRHLARILLEKGAGKVSVLALARATISR